MFVYLYYIKVCEFCYNILLSIKFFFYEEWSKFLMLSSVITFGTKIWGNSPSKESVPGYPKHALLTILF